MADVLYIDASALTKGSAAFKRLITEFPDKVSKVLNASALNVEEKAKQRSPADRGASGLRGSISADTSKPLKKHVTVNVPYAAYIEFGTGKYAAQQVAKYPANYQQFAAQFRGKGGGSFTEFLKLLTEWVRRKGITGTYSVKTHRRTGNKAVQQQQNEQAAYAIAISILKNGIHPHPFLIPALIEEERPLLNNLETLLKSLKLV